MCVCSSVVIVDPTVEEESLSTATLTVVTDVDERLYAVHKPGERKEHTSGLSIKAKLVMYRESVQFIST